MISKALPERYEITGESASGGFGSVIKYNDLHLERFVAVKTITDPIDAHRMNDELNALMKLRSKHVVELYDAIRFDDGGIAIIEEFIDGPSLSDIQIDNMINNSDELFKILWQIASGISEIHSHDIIHRDIKPANMKIDKEGIVKIFDFGLSRSVDNASTVGFVGTRIYAAPELFLTRPVFDKSIDTYAFAVTAMYLTRTPVPEGFNIPPKMLYSNPFDKASIQLPVHLKELLYQCLSQVPSERPKMAEISEYLKRLILKNTHRALLISQLKPPVILCDTHKIESFNNPNVGSIEIKYSGMEFYISSLSGEVNVNNITAKKGNILPNSCVIILGPKGKSSIKREFITFDLSSPEVVL
ncbi:serine/threonine-protein kinase [Providencia stuartii]|uniref:serine/threonine-protein kinase n=1 Tax=Providencia stuartii TaxID=588 RepID=UPI0033276D35